MFMLSRHENEALLLISCTVIVEASLSSSYVFLNASLFQNNMQSWGAASKISFPFEIIMFPLMKTAT